MLDISKQAKVVDAEEAGTFVHLVGLDDQLMYFDDGSGEPQPVGITVAGMQSHRYRQIENQQRKRRIRPKDLTGQKLLADSVEKVAYCTLSWSGISDGDTPLVCNLENARALYNQLSWVMDQVSEAMVDSTRFFTNESS